MSQTRTKSAGKISWRESSSMTSRRYSAPFHSDGMAMSSAVMVGWRQSRNSILEEFVIVVALRKTRSEVMRLDCLALQSPTLLKGGLGVVHFGCHQTGPTPTLETHYVQYKLNYDDDDDDDDDKKWTMMMMMMMMMHTFAYHYHLNLLRNVLSQIWQKIWFSLNF